MPERTTVMIDVENEYGMRCRVECGDESTGNAMMSAILGVDGAGMLPVLPMFLAKLFADCVDFDAVDSRTFAPTELRAVGNAIDAYVDAIDKMRQKLLDKDEPDAGTN